MGLCVVGFVVLTAGTVAGPLPPKTGAALSGTWTVVSCEQDGKPFKYPAKGTLFTFEDGKVLAGPKKDKVFYTFKADAKKDPKEIDLVREEGKGKVILRGIYRMEKGRLLICIGVASASGADDVIEGKRPTEFKSGPKVQLLTFESSGD
jgi:uncharacterized protein (TIGR03067 family)